MANQEIYEVNVQREYYASTAAAYDRMHVEEYDQHMFALGFMVNALDYLGVNSILDVGAGTGRVHEFIKKHRPNIKIIGIEPVKALREMGYQKGISKDHLIEGDATRIQFEAGAFDLVCCFGVLHHIKEPQLAVAEMLRVAKKAIFISDSNNFGQGGDLMRFVKQLINALGLWKAFDFVKTKGKGYTISEGDGLAYSYSVFNNVAQIRQSCSKLHFLNTDPSGPNLYRSAGHVAVLGIKD